MEYLIKSFGIFFLISENHFFLLEEWKSINLKLSDSESKVCEITAQLEELRSRESTIGVHII